jgi:hypothetical protein
MFMAVGLCIDFIKQSALLFSHSLSDACLRRVNYLSLHTVAEGYAAILALVSKIISMKLKESTERERDRGLDCVLCAIIDNFHLINPEEKNECSINKEGSLFLSAPINQLNKRSLIYSPSEQGSV